LRRRIELIEQAQHEADVCRAQAAEEARLIVHDALEKADALLRALRHSDAELRDMFASGAMTHRMPPPRRSADEATAQAGADRPHDSVSPTISVPYPAQHGVLAQDSVPSQGHGGAHMRQPQADPEPASPSS
jgi:hypothetical protein